MIIPSPTSRVEQDDFMRCQFLEMLNPLPAPENVDPQWFEHLKAWVILSSEKHQKARNLLMRGIESRFLEETKNDPVFEPEGNELQELPIFEDLDEVNQPIRSMAMFMKVFETLGVDDFQKRCMSDYIDNIMFDIRVLKTILSSEEFERAQQEVNNH